MAANRYLIVNADDFGLSPGVNRGIIRAYQDGIVTSASLMVRPDAAFEAAEYSRENPGLCLGLHVDLGEWTYRDGNWVPLYEVVPISNITELKGETDRQMEAFRKMVGRDPTHIDSHQHVHLREPIRSILIDVARTFNVPLRGCCQDIHFCGEFYGQTSEGLSISGILSVDGFLKIIKTLPPGITELACHPGDGGTLNTMYKLERELETEILCSLEVREFIGRLGIKLCAFADIMRNVKK